MVGNMLSLFAQIVSLMLLACFVDGFKEFPQSFALRSSYKRFEYLISQRAVQRSAEVETLLDQVKASNKKGTIVVIKYGGHAMENEELKELFCEDIADLYRHAGIVPVVVHGGGPQIAKMLKRLDVKSNFVDGLRVTDDATMEVAQMVLCGSINKEISGRISNKPGVKGAVGLAGLDSGIIKGTQKDQKLGLVGEPRSVNADIIRGLVELGIIPVIAPIGMDMDGGQSLNINADTAAGAVAEALQADVFLLLTDIVGVLDKDKQLIEQIPSSSLGALKDDGTISGGMIPKLETAAQAVEAGVGVVSIMDGRERHCILRALSGKKFGTLIKKG